MQVQESLWGRGRNVLFIITIYKLILSTPNKSCDLYPIPTALVKQCCAELLPIITNIINGSLVLVSGVFPSDYKIALVRPNIKKSNLDPNVLKAAFHLVDHEVLVKRLDNYFGFSVIGLVHCFLLDKS